MAAEALVRAEDVTRVYRRGGEEVVAVDHADLVVERGEFVAVHGRSGSGKTTLLNLLGGLDQPSSGTIHFDGTDLARLSSDALVQLRRDHLAFVFQAFGLLPILSAAENVEIPMRLRRLDPDVRDARVADLLAVVGLGERAGHRPHELSGGEQQRVAIARALANDPDLLIADEPTGQLDSVTGRTIMELIAGLVRDRGLAVIVATHDPTMISMADRVVEVRDGRVVGSHAPSVPVPDTPLPDTPVARPPTVAPPPAGPPPPRARPRPRPAAGERSPFAPPDDDED